MSVSSRSRHGASSSLATNSSTQSRHRGFARSHDDALTSGPSAGRQFFGSISIRIGGVMRFTR
jgi:hypothetical protein